jgi:hypothetical protein
VLTAGLLVLLAGGFMALPAILIAPAEVMPADVMLHLDMNAHSDADAYVSRLHQQGVAGNIVCISSQAACDVYPADYVARHLVTLGVPEENVSTLHLSSRSCWAKYLPDVVEYVRRRGWQSALLVVDPIGSRFEGRVARRYFDRAGLQLAITYSSRDRQECVQGWWRTHSKAQRMVRGAVTSALDMLYPQCR